VNILSNERYNVIITLLEQGFSLREVAKRTKSHRSAVKRAARDLEAKRTNLPTGNDIQSVPTCAPGFTRKITPQRKLPSQCEPYRAWIEEQVQRGRNGIAIFDDLKEMHGYTGAYDSVRRFIKKMRHREPERYDVLVFPPGEEAQVDYGQGAPMPYTNGKLKRPYLFVMTLKYSGMSFRKVVWHTNQEVWCRLHEEAFRHFGGAPRFVVLDNLKEGVIKP
jgi:transposase